jgi:serine/threonine-protein phosphatase 5
VIDTIVVMTLPAESAELCSAQLLSEANALKERGNKLFGAGNYLDALEVYEEAITMAPQEAIYYCNASACCARLNEFGKAALFAAEALRRDASLTKAYFRRAVALMGLQQWKAALEDLRLVARSSESLPSDVASRMQQCEKELQKIAFARAIHVDVFELDMPHISALEVDESYAGPRVADDEPIKMTFVKELVDWLRDERRLHAHYAYRILYEANKLFRAQPSLVDVVVPKGGVLTVCGDVHGQFFDLLQIFETNDWPSASHSYLFNGDIVDRGAHSVEVLLLLFALKIAFPDNFFVARGNHESESVNRMHGFYEEITRKYGDDGRMFSLSNTVLNALPLVHTIQNEIFVVHGGLPMNARTLTLDDIRAIDRLRIPEPGSVMSQLLWSDPQDSPGISPSHRGEGILFGPDVTADFLSRNGLRCIIRSHVWEPTGWREQHNGQCITIFSAPNYTGASSPAALVNIDDSLAMKFVQYEAASFQGKTVRNRPSPQFNGLFPN